ncbi:MAG: DMT family transporter [Rhodospirillaceae bacterium]
MAPTSARRAGTDGRLLAFLLLALVALFWAGNTILARAMSSEVPPFALAFWRIFLSVLMLAPFALASTWNARDLVLRHFWLLNLLALLSTSAFNTLVYLGLNHTQAINGNLLQGALPICIIAASALFAGRRILLRQWVGVIFGLVGLTVIVIRGDPARLAGLAVNPGDPLVFLGIFSSAVYAAILHRRPAGIGLVPFMFLMMVFSTVHVLPFFVWEHFTHRVMPMTAAAVGTALYVAIFASVIAQLFFVEGVKRLGAPTAGNMIYLTPVFGVLMAIGLLGETLHMFHVAGVTLIAAGIWLATSSGRQRARTGS